MRLVANHLFVAVVSLWWTGVANAEKRVWTAKSGQRVIATLEDQTADAVSLRIANRRQPVVVMLDRLIETDQAFVRRVQARPQRIMISLPGAHARRTAENPIFADYVYRLRERRAYALESRREYNSRKGPAVFYMGSMPNPMLPMGSGIEMGRVRQPPLAVRRYRRVAVVAHDFVPSNSN
jgi:hypothetical protein